ncbi:predicted protein [Sclerotinia sclerotiorum 1980 UF-70]|uniref:Uncharacterized protein n=1 Tax=Sclerotinia sclerotiorum (strain ATCC 18683 / 1980 / Ss-1) TaxID=665079 RepID=A7EWE3_SCLS1|nr:predicted protein [Sclerotinia sclerotiorum 1980 UF-70]EDN93785.1 predicted protein [Sclerotinia sclerotiorum 1980 UF-70]
MFQWLRIIPGVKLSFVRFRVKAAEIENKQRDKPEISGQNSLPMDEEINALHVGLCPRSKKRPWHHKTLE